MTLVIISIKILLLVFIFVDLIYSSILTWANAFTISYFILEMIRITYLQIF